MTDSAKTHDFDWITARTECALPHQFECLKREAENNVTIRNGDQDPPRYEFHEEAAHKFQVYAPVQDEWGTRPCLVIFRLEKDHIEIRDEWPRGSVWERNKMTITAVLGAKGECRFRIDDSVEELLRWQVLQRALDPLFFQESL